MKPLLLKMLEVSSKILSERPSSIRMKQNSTLVTDVDEEVERALVRLIRESYPDHGIIGEEHGGEFGGEYTWVIDPIDGTAMFAHGLQEFGTLVALMRGRGVVLSGMSLPAMGLTYVAEKGKGAFRNGERIHVGNFTRLKDALVWFGSDPKDEATTMREGALYARLVLNSLYVIGSNGPYPCGTVADGRCGVAINLKARIWDVAAPALIIEEAGGVVTDDRGNPYDYSSTEKNYPFVAGNPELHRQVMRIIQG